MLCGMGIPLGGRWPYMFLVKKTCTEYAIGKISWAHRREVPEAPKDYQWVCGARKKDIEWQAMHEWKRKELTERFCKLENFFRRENGQKEFWGFGPQKGFGMAMRINTTWEISWKTICAGKALLKITNIHSFPMILSLGTEAGFRG